MTPSRSSRVVVDSFAALLARPFRDRVNAVCWPRALPGDFAEVARLLVPAEGVVVVEPDELEALSLSPAGRVAADIMLADFRRLEALGREPLLNGVASYERDDRGLPIATDVLSFHVDRAPVEVETWLCTYFGAPSEGLDNDDARRRLDDPAVRAALLSTCDDGVDFDDFVKDGSFDLHYAANDGAVPFSFGTGALWRIAVQWPGAPVLPCIHRAPTTTTPRLLLIC